MGFPHCFYLLSKFILLHSYSMKLTFLPYWIFLSLLPISLQTMGIHKSSSDLDLLVFISLSAFVKLTPKSLSNSNILYKTKVSGHYLLSGHFYLIVPSVTQTQNISKWIYSSFLVSQLSFPFVPHVPSCQDINHINWVSSLITSPQTNQSPAHAIYSSKDSLIRHFFQLSVQYHQFRCKLPCI